MTEPISLAEAKAHLRVVFDDDNDYIENLITAARQYAEGYQNRVYMTYTTGTGETAVTVEAEAMPAIVKAACLLIIGHLYEQRTAATEKPLTEVPLGVKALLNLNRNVPL